MVRDQYRGLRSRTAIGWGGDRRSIRVSRHRRWHQTAREGRFGVQGAGTDSSGDPQSGLLGGLYGLYPSYTWQLLLGPVFAALGVFIIWFLLRELPSLRLKVLTMAAIGLFGLAFALDFIEGMNSDPLDRVASILTMEPRRLVHFSKSTEEFMEMLATTSFLFVFLKKLTSLTPSITFEIDPGQLSNE